MSFVTKRYDVLKGIIPETDVDGIDVADGFASMAENVDFQQGFWNLCVAPQQSQLPSNISTSITNGYEILSSKYFYHSSRGHVFFYCLYKLDGAVHRLKFFVDNTELSIDEQSNDVTFNSKPTKINYNLVNDQLKINLNCTGTYNQLSKTIILNLTLVYLPVITYVTGQVYERSAGWYLFPRWLGNNYSNIVLGSSTPYTEDFEDTDYDGRLTLNHFTHYTDYPLAGSGSIKSTVGTEALIHLYDICAIKSLSFLWKYEDYLGEEPLTVTVRRYGESEILTVVSFGTTTQSPVVPVILPLNLIFEDHQDLTLYFDFPSSARLVLDNLTFTPFTDITVIVKNIDGQRSVLVNNKTLDLFDKTTITLDKKELDWRVEVYELYSKTVPDSDIYYLLGQAPVTGEWIDASTTVAYTFSNLSSALTTTLNFNYGLGATVKVNTESNIYSEVVYRGRVYFVKNDYRVYQSHMAGSGQIQPDSFPYQEDIKFGYFEVETSEINRGLSVSPLEELVVKTNKNTHIYYIQVSSGTAYRTVKTVNGSSGVSSVDSIMKSLNGKPEAEIVAWYNNTGIYIYGGGRNAPKDISIGSFKNYWLKNISESVKDLGIGFFFESRNEYWICLGRTIWIYELSYGTYKRYYYPIAFKCFVGIKDENIYFIGSDNNLYIVDITTESYLSGYFETHYTTNLIKSKDSNESNLYPAPPYWDKILQELYAGFVLPVTGVIKVTIIADGNTITPSIYLNSYRLLDSVLTPLLIRYKKIKFKVELSNPVKISEFGYRYSIKEEGTGVNLPETIIGIGMESGGQSGVVL